MRHLPFDFDLSEVLLALQQSGAATLVNAGNAVAKSFLLAQVAQKTNFENLFFASEIEKIDEISAAAALFFPHIFRVGENLSPPNFYELRHEIFQKKSEPTLFLFENLSETLSQKCPSEKEIAQSKIQLEIGKSFQIFALFAELENLGFAAAADEFLNQGEFLRRGEILFLRPPNLDFPLKIQFDGEKIQTISALDPQQKTETQSLQSIEIFPSVFENPTESLAEFLLSPSQKSVFFGEDLESEVSKNFWQKYSGAKINLTTFPKNEETFFPLNFFSVLPFYTISDFVVEVKERLRREFKIVLATKKFQEIEKIFRENHIMFDQNVDENWTESTAKIWKLKPDDFLPHSFQNSDRKILFLTDREIFQFDRRSRQKKAVSGLNLDLLTSLKPGDRVVHSEHGIGQFDGICRREISGQNSAREFLKIQYAGADRLFVPVESAEKISKFIGDDPPPLHKLGGADWARQNAKIKKESEKIAKELLKLYAARELAKTKAFPADDQMMVDFCEKFPYQLTPGQKSAWDDVRRDLERERPMDRLVCGDVGFGKTEIAMRAAFKCFRAGRQCAILAPITILAEQHFQSFSKRIAGQNFGVRVELLSRFQSAADQKRILADLKLGLVDIVIGTHRLLSDDVQFKNLGLLVIDEEQRFGVQQKEKLKKIRAGVDLLTMTATPIPRTLNMSLSKLKDISTITTPPPGRLPVITEVRKFNLNLIAEQIRREVARGGQVYFLHNRVQTIDGFAAQLQSLMPEIRLLVAHGQMPPEILADKIHAFQRHEADVLIASTIIENGIDLANANTLIVSRAEKFGLSQLYQLRGRVGRSRTQSYAFFLYSGQKLELDARKRLRAIVEASELGSGFQIAMRDLEIRGAGEILGGAQSGAMKTAGVSHFMRILNQTVEKMKSGEIDSGENEAEENISVEIPLSAFIPPDFVPDAAEKIQLYKELAAAENVEALSDLKKEMRDDFGYLPLEVENLFRVLQLKIAARNAHLSGIKISAFSDKKYEMVLRMGAKFTPDQIFGLVQNSPRQWIVTGTALKRSVAQLSVDWFSEVLADVEGLVPKRGKMTDVR